MIATRKNESTMKLVEVIQDKPIFTARTEDNLYVGCFRVDDGMFITAESFDSALPAANAARKLLKKFTLTKKFESNFKQNKKKNKNSSMKNKKQLRYRGRLFTSDEVDRMPLLKFREVWVIIKGDEFVSDALNQEKKKLVEFVPTRENARFFTCHEEAKRIMRVLKSTVGPGFDLKRFFISNEDS